MVTGFWSHWLWAGPCRVEASGQPSSLVLVRALREHRWGWAGRGPWPPRTFLGCQPQGLYPNSSKTAKGPVQTLPTTLTLGGGRGWFPGTHQLGAAALSPSAFPRPSWGRQSLSFPQVGASPAFWYWVFLGHPPPPAINETSRGLPPSSCPPLHSTCGGGAWKGPCPQLACPPAHPSVQGPWRS